MNGTRTACLGIIILTLSRVFLGLPLPMVKGRTFILHYSVSHPERFLGVRVIRFTGSDALPWTLYYFKRTLFRGSKLTSKVLLDLVKELVKS